MVEISSCNVVKPYLWGVGGQGWSLVNSEALNVREEELMPGCSETPHKHELASQSYYILKGYGQVVIQDKTLKLTQGDCVLIPPSYVHIISNESQEPLRFLVISSPPINEDRIEVEF
jgi:mannose-6-phosphate isomerase-like protein (cupin superfamily)